MKPTVYIETTIPSYLTAWPSRNAIRVAQQELTKTWWTNRDFYELRTSRLVILEAEAGDEVAADLRLAALEGIPLLEESDTAALLTESLIQGLKLPLKASVDAGHIAISAVHRMKYLLTWNCRHIANAILRPSIESICRTFGFEPPTIVTPQELVAFEGQT